MHNNYERNNNIAKSKEEGLEKQLKFLKTMNIGMALFYILIIIIANFNVNIALALLIFNSLAIVWGITNYQNIKDKINKPTPVESKEYIHTFFDFNKIPINKDIVKLREQEENKEKNNKEVLIQEVSEYIKPDLFIEWIILIREIAKQNPRLLNNIINDLKNINANNFDIQDEYFTINGIAFTIRGILIRYSTNGDNYQKYCESKNMHLIKLAVFEEKEEEREEQVSLKRTKGGNNNV